MLISEQCFVRIGFFGLDWGGGTAVSVFFVLHRIEFVHPAVDLSERKIVNDFSNGRTDMRRGAKLNWYMTCIFSFPTIGLNATEQRELKLTIEKKTYSALTAVGYEP